MISSGPGDGTHLRRGSIIRVRGEDTGGAIAAYETTLRPGALIPPHTHPGDVWVYVLTGQTSVLVGDEIAHGGPGTFLLKPRDVVHAMWNETATPSRIFEILTPGGGERFFEDVAALAEGDDEGFEKVRARHGLVFLGDHPRLAELRARVDAVTTTPPVVALREATPDDRNTLANLLQLYLYDIAPFAHGGWNDIGADGRFAYAWLDHYWIEPARHAFLIEVDGDLGGFVLVNEHSVVPEWTPARSIAEFFVLRRHRGRSVGALAAHAVFDRFPGRWQVAQDAPNVGAQGFWRATIDRYTSGNVETRHLDDDHWHGPVLLFTSPS